MKSGVNYVPVPYEPVDANAISTYDATIPSDATLVQGVYFAWNENGFTGQTWLLDAEILSHPLKDNTHQQLNSEEDIATWFETHTDLNDIFSSWHPNFEQYFAFESLFVAGGPAAGCAYR